MVTVWNGLVFQAFFIRRIVTASKSLVACTVFCSVGFLCHYNSPATPAPLTSSHQSLYLKYIEYFNQRRQQKRKLILIFKHLGNINRAVFSWTNPPFCGCERPRSCWWWGIADTCQQENRTNQLTKPWLTLNQLKVFSIWFYPRGLCWFN